MLYEYTYCEAHRVADWLSHFACGFMAAAQRYRLATGLSLQKNKHHMKKVQDDRISWVTDHKDSNENILICEPMS